MNTLYYYKASSTTSHLKAVLHSEVGVVRRLSLAYLEAFLPGTVQFSLHNNTRGMQGRKVVTRVDETLSSTIMAFKKKKYTPAATKYFV